MSSGVDQIKPVPTGGKEERNIPWSQQVDEASCENLTIGSNDGPSAQTTPKFQYPPFKENNHPSINYKSKKYGRPSYHNSNKDDYNTVAWNGSNFRRPIGENHLVQREQRDRLGNQGNIESLNIQNHNEHKVTAQQPTVAQKKTTWALIASQPAKHTSKVSLTSAQKKKGPGMPPPPMVPGKHDLNASAWDIPSNNPPPVPSPTPHPDISQNENSLHESIQHNTFIRKDENKSNEHLKDDHRNISYRSRNTTGPQVRKNWNQTFPSNNTNRRPVNMDENKFQRKIENNRRNPYVGVRNDQENGGQVYQKSDYAPDNIANEMEILSQTSQAVLDELRIKNNYNPATLDIENAACARYFVIKSYSEDDIHRSIKYEIWCSTETGNKRLDDAFKEQTLEKGVVLLFFSVNGSGHFCGVAQMMTPVDYNSTASVWSQDKWKGKFKVKWLYVKDVPNSNFRHIKLENNENKPVTHSRDTQEVPNYKGVEVLQIIHSFKHDTSIFDDFHHYEIKQVEGCAKKYVSSDQQSFRGSSPNGRNNHKIIDERDRDRDRDRDFERESRGASSRHFNNGTTLNYRERNKAGPQYFQDPKNSSDHLNRYTKKYEPVRRDKVANKHMYKEREQVRDRVKNGNNFRVDLKDSKADNEFEVHR